MKVTKAFKNDRYTQPANTLHHFPKDVGDAILAPLRSHLERTVDRDNSASGEFRLEAYVIKPELVYFTVEGDTVQPDSEALVSAVSDALTSYVEDDGRPLVGYVNDVEFLRNKGKGYLVGVGLGFDDSK